LGSIYIQSAENEFSLMIARNRRKQEPSTVLGIIREAQSEKRTSLYEDEAERLAVAFGIPVVHSKLVTSAEEAIKAANQMGYPVVMKIVSRNVLHKSDVGGVVLDIGSAREVGKTFIALENTAKRKSRNGYVRGVLVQKMLPPTYEFTIGGVKDPQFGPTVMFGLGGIHVELFNDITFRLAPLKEVEARRMMSEIRSAPLLSGFRGRKPLDVGSAARAIVNVGRLLQVVPEISSIDINPLLIYPRRCVGVDVRVALEDSPENRRPR